MPELRDGGLMLDGAAEPDRREAKLDGGNLIAYTTPAPDKDTDNEDAVAAVPYGSDAAVLLVADGAGGLPAGRRASQTAVITLLESLSRSLAEALLLRTAVLNGIEAANEAVQNLGTGSATTLTLVTIEGITARAYQVGDSEAIIVGQRGAVRLQTMAHSPTGFAVEAGFLDEREALHHEERHLVSNFLGSAGMRIDVGAEVGLRPRDTVLVASDGVMDNVHVAELIDLIRKGPLNQAAQKVIDLASRRMRGASATQPSKPDDLSLILYRKPYRARTVAAPA